MVARTRLRLSYRLEKLIVKIVFAFKMNDQIIQKNREVCGKKVWENYGGEIAFGLFKGVKINKYSAWSGARDIGPKILGLYENQILKWVQQKKFDLFIDIGASDGYYALGMLHSKTALKAITFEISAEDRKIAKTSAILNNVDDKILIKGEAISPEIIQILNKFSNGLIIIDIEGGEYSLITRELLEAAKYFHFIIEIHNTTHPDIKTNLVNYCNEFHNIEILTDLERNFPADSFTINLTDNERCLLISEGRQYSMNWLALSPKEFVAQ